MVWGTSLEDTEGHLCSQPHELVNTILEWVAGYVLISSLLPLCRQSFVMVWVNGAAAEDLTLRSVKHSRKNLGT